MPKKNNFNILIYKKALDFSYNFYQLKFRKGIKFPYFTYLSSVSNLVIENNGSTEEAVASLLHDIFENENGLKKAATIKSKFGDFKVRVSNQINALQRRANKIIKVVNPPELKLHIFNESDYKDKKIPLAQSQWEMNIVIEKKPDNWEK